MRRGITTVVVISCLVVVFGAAWVATNRKQSRVLENPIGGGQEVVYLGSSNVVFQSRQKDCGVAALAMILDHYGIKSSPGDMEREAKTDFDGASMLKLKELAMSKGLNAEGWRLRVEDLPRFQFPAILLVKDRHFVVIDSVGEEGSLFVRDPAVGRLRIPNRKVYDIWNGETLEFSRAGY